MKRKLFRNYYSKIIVISVISIVTLVTFSLIILLYVMNQNRIAYETEKQDKVLAEFVKCYDDVIRNRNLAYRPLFEENNMKVLQQFCQEEHSTSEKGALLKDLKSIMKDVSKLDERIEYVSLQRLSDEGSYLYDAESEQLWNQTFQFEETEIKDENFVIRGGRKMTYYTKKSEKRVYGVQSKPFSSQSAVGNPDYQITVWYSMNMYDSILAKYNINPEVRFMIVTRQGMIIYDSWEQYEDNQVSWFEHMDAIHSPEEYYEVDQSLEHIKKQDTKRGDSLVLCMFSEGYMDNFYFSSEMRMVSFIAVFVNMLVVVGMLVVRRTLMSKFHKLEAGIVQIDGNNLKYRMPESKREDEFSRIAGCFNRMLDRLESTIEKNYVYHLLQYKAEYKALETKVNPHFLYNSLEVIYGMSEEKGQSEIAEAVMLLSRIFDYQIHGDTIVSIWREQDAVQHYMDFLTMRYRNALDYIVEIDEEILDYKIPKQIFHTIIENYMKHGFRGDGTDFISVMGYQSEDGMIHVDFCDNGKEDRLRNEESSAELDSVYRRMKILCNETCKLEINSNGTEPGINMSLIFKGVLTILES